MLVVMLTMCPARCFGISAGALGDTEEPDEIDSDLDRQAIDRVVGECLLLMPAPILQM